MSVTSTGKHSDYPESFFSDMTLNSCSRAVLEILNIYKCGPSLRYLFHSRSLFTQNVT